MDMTTAVGATVSALLGDLTLKRVTLVLSPKLTVCATRRFKGSKRNTREDLALTVGAPNFKSRQIIKKARKEGASFPLSEFFTQRQR